MGHRGFQFIPLEQDFADICIGVACVWQRLPPLLVREFQRLTEGIDRLMQLPLQRLRVARMPNDDLGQKSIA